MNELLDKAPTFIEDYEPLDMQEKFWAMRFPDGSFLATRHSRWRPGTWRRASKTPNDLCPVGDWYDNSVGRNDGHLVEVTLEVLLYKPPKNPDRYVGVVVIDGFPHVARYIEARPGEK
jgi:hypothetical protein